MHQELEQELSEMDRITQLQDAIDELVTIMTSSLTYLTSKTSFAQLSPEIPVTKSRENAVPPHEFEANKRELVDDLVRKAKELEFLIGTMPVVEAEDVQLKRLSKLDEEMKVANEEYRAALERATTLHREFSKMLEMMLGGHAPVLKPV